MPHHPIDLGEQMGTSLRAYKSRIGSYLLITLMPYLASIVIFAVATLAGVVVIVGMVHSLTDKGLSFGRAFAPMVLFVVIILAAAALTGFFSLKAAGMKSVLTRLTIDHADRGGTAPKPTFGDAWRGSQGFVPRILPNYLLLLAVTVAVSMLYVVVALAIMLPNIGSLDSSDAYSRMYGSMLGLTGISLLFEVGIGVAYLIIGTRLYPLVPLIALERVGGIAALRRAWALTKGYGLRTFGYWFVASLIPVGIVYAVSFVGIIVGSGLLGGAFSTSGSGAPTVRPGLLIASGLLIYLPVIIASVLVMPFLGIFQTVYTIDLQRREQLGMRPGQPIRPQPGYQQPGYQQPSYQQPGPQPPPGPPYGQPPGPPTS
jgi:hypothetical protein